MENRAHALAAGLFTLLLGAALVLSLWWFSDGRVETREYLLVGKGNVTGLNQQASVLFRGIPAGQVTDIRIDPANPRHILVAIEISAELPITRGTRASLGYQGVTGLAYVQLTDSGDDPTPLEGEGGAPPRLPLAPGLMDQLTDTTLDALARFRAIADKIAPFFDEANLARLTVTLERLESAAIGIDRTFADAPETLAAIRAVLNPTNMERLAATLDNLERVSAESGPAVSELRTLMKRLQGMAERVDAAAAVAGEGLLGGTLPQLNTLLKELTVTSRRMGRLIEEVEAAPQMLVTGRRPNPPGPGETGFEPDRP
jgi:phospholipid/cholesterol/gamma-HCH transport system substrate-binding protein